MIAPLARPIGNPPATGDFQTALNWGTQQVGKPYIWGSAGGRSDLSGTASGYDCSGFVSQFYHQMGRSVPAQTLSAYNATTHVDLKEAQPGDIVEWMDPNHDATQEHMAIYLGNGKILQSGGTQHQVNIGDINQFGSGAFEIRRAAGGPSTSANATATDRVSTAADTAATTAKPAATANAPASLNDLADAFHQKLNDTAAAATAAINTAGVAKDQVTASLGDIAAKFHQGLDDTVKNLGGSYPMVASQQPTPSDSLTNPMRQTGPTDMSVSPPSQPTVFDAIGQARDANNAMLDKYPLAAPNVGAGIDPYGQIVQQGIPQIISGVQRGDLGMEGVLGGLAQTASGALSVNPGTGGAGGIVGDVATQAKDLAQATPQVVDALTTLVKSRLPGEADINAAAGGLPGLLEKLGAYSSEVRNGLEDFVTAQTRAGQKPEEIGATVQQWMDANPPTTVVGQMGAGAQRLRQAAQDRGPLVLPEEAPAVPSSAKVAPAFPSPRPVDVTPTGNTAPNPFKLSTEPVLDGEQLTNEQAATHIENLGQRYEANDRQIQQLQDTLQSNKGVGEYKGIVRPNWAAGFTDDALARMAKDNGLNPYDPTWGQQARDIPGKAYYKNANDTLQQPPAQIRAEIKRLQVEQDQLIAAGDHAYEADAKGATFYRVPTGRPAELPWQEYNPSAQNAAPTAGPTPANRASSPANASAAPEGAAAPVGAGSAPAPQPSASTSAASATNRVAPTARTAPLPAGPPAVPAPAGMPTSVAADAVPRYQQIAQKYVDQAAARRAAAAGGAGQPPFEPPAPPTGATPPTGPQQRAPVTLDQVAPQGPLSRITSTVNATFQPIENLPNGEVKEALKRYAAAVGSQSQGAAVVGDTAGRQIAASGPMLTAEGVPVDSAQAMRLAVETKAQADLHGVLQSNGLSEGTPEIADILNNIRNPSAIATNPLGKAVLGVNSALKGSLFGLSNLHNYTEAVTAAVSGGPEAVANYTRAFVSPSFYDGVRYGTMAPKFDRAAMAGVTGLLKGGGGSDVQQLANVATRAVIGGIGGAGAGYEESLRRGDTENAGRNMLIGAAAGAGANVAAPALFGSLFGRAVPLAKVTVFDQLTKGGMPELQAAASVNRTFGGLNYAQMGRSKTLQDALRLLATAPDWNESTLRSLGTAITGQGGGAGFQRGVIAKAVAGSMIGSEILNYALTGHSTAQNEPGHQLEVQIGTDNSGKGVYMGFMPGNYQAYGNLIDKIVGSPAQASTDLGFFGTGRIGMLPQIAMGLATGSEYIGGPKAKNELASAAAKVAPIGISSVAQGLERGVPGGDLAASVLAGPNLRYGSAANQTTVGGSRTAPVPAGRSVPAPSGKRSAKPARAPRR